MEDDGEGGLIIPQSVAGQEERDLHLCLVGRVLTNKNIIFWALKHTLASVWRLIRGVSIKESGPNLFLFQFYHEVDFERVVDGGPWTFNTDLLIFKQISDVQQLFDIHLNEVDIWVQLHGIPFGLRFEWAFQHIGNFIGSIITSDTRNFSELWHSYMRVLVRIDIRQPLKKGMKIKKERGGWAWIEFKYERPPTFCFFVGD